MNSDQLSSLSLVCIGSPIIETGSHMFCLLPFQLQFLVFVRSSLKVTMGMSKGRSLCKLPLKQPLVLPSLIA